MYKVNDAPLPIASLPHGVVEIAIQFSQEVLIVNQSRDTGGCLNVGMFKAENL